MILQQMERLYSPVPDIASEEVIVEKLIGACLSLSE